MSFACIARVVAMAVCAGLSLPLAGIGAARAEGGLRLFLMGDSFAVGMAPFLGADLIKVTIGGNAHFRWEALDGVDRGTRVVIVLGTNDSLEYSEDGAANYVHRVREIARGLARRAAEVVWVGPPCVLPGHAVLDDRRLEDTHGRIAEAIAALPEHDVRNVRFVGLRDLTTDGDRCLRDYRTDDQIHFTAQGYQRLAAHLRAATTPTGRRGPR